MESTAQLLTGHLSLIGVALILAGLALAWPRSRILVDRRPHSFGIAQLRAPLGLIIAVLGVVLFAVGLTREPDVLPR